MLRPFDCIFTWPKRWNFISWFITWITGGGPSHVRLYIKGLGIKDENGREYDFIEATWPKVRFGFMEEVDPKLYRIEYGRHSELPYPVPQELEDKAIAEMKRLIGVLYDLGELAFSQFFDELGIDHIDHSDPERPVCSSLAEHILGVLTYFFCPSDQLVSPADIMRSKFYVKVKKGGD